MRRACLLAASILLLPMLAVNTGAKEWRGITPLRSTRADVIKLLGSPNLTGERYELDDGVVSILFSGGPCKTGWNVSKDTVIDIMFQPDADLTLSDLRLDLSKYRKEQDYEVIKRWAQPDINFEVHMRYAVIVEEGESSFGAHVPDLRLDLTCDQRPVMTIIEKGDGLQGRPA